MRAAIEWIVRLFGACNVSAIPPDIAGSAAQAGYAAREASRVRDADRTGQANTSARNVQAADEAVESVETTDGDTAVFADAEGAGSQGRSLEEESTEEESEGKEGSESEASQRRLDIRI